MSANTSAWALASKLFGQREPTLAVALSSSERDALALLSDMGLTSQGAFDNRYVLCLYCQLHRGAVCREADGLYCQCEECGIVPISLSSQIAWQIDPARLIRQFRLALDIPSQQSVTEIATGIWRIGSYRKLPVILARSAEDVLRHPADIRRAAKRAHVIAPKPLHGNAPPFDDHLTWLPMEECFHIYGGQIRFDEPGMLADDEIDDLIAALHGPFSADFRWVHLPNVAFGPIELTDAQAAIFKSLWHFKGVPREAHVIMARAELKSDKPIDAFKIKACNKGNPKYEAPLQAYQALVTTDRRAGTYAMTCAM